MQRDTEATDKPTPLIANLFEIAGMMNCEDADEVRLYVENEPERISKLCSDIRAGKYD